MENASKALIIAGAILIAIVLVTVGVLVVNSLNTDDATDMLDQQQVQAFNAKFEASTGTNVTGTTLKQLITAIITNNNSNLDDDSRQVSIGEDGKETADVTALNTLKSTITSADRYKVTVTEYLGGLIHVITYEKTT